MSKYWHELKACPFCGSSNTTLDYFEISCPQELGTIVVCNDCGASASSIVDWNTRPIEDALLKRAEEDERLKAALHKQIETLEKYGAGICRSCYDLIDDEDKTIRENQLHAERDRAVSMVRWLIEQGNTLADYLSDDLTPEVIQTVKEWHDEAIDWEARNE